VAAAHFGCSLYLFFLFLSNFARAFANISNFTCSNDNSHIKMANFCTATAEEMSPNQPNKNECAKPSVCGDLAHAFTFRMNCSLEVIWASKKCVILEKNLPR